MKRAFDWGAQQGYIEFSPIRHVKKPSGQRRETTLTEDQRLLILNAATDDAFRDYLQLVQETGARPQEVRLVELRHVDWTNGLWVFPPSEHKTGQKTGKPRIIFLTPTAFEVTRRLMLRSPTGPLCRNAQGQPWTRNAIGLRFRRLRTALKGKLPADLCAYHFRHSFATDTLERGVDPITVAELMGHRDATMVSRVYQHLGKADGPHEGRRFEGRGPKCFATGGDAVIAAAKDTELAGTEMAFARQAVSQARRSVSATRMPPRPCPKR